MFGLAVVMLGLGAILGPGRDAPGSRRWGNLLHGTGLFLMLVGGFGMMARLGIGGPGSWPVWLIVKMGIWLLLALLPVAVRRGVVPRSISWLIAAFLVATAAWSALIKPFLP